VTKVVGQKDRGHAAPPQLALEPVPVSQTALELLAEVCHTGPVMLVESPKHTVAHRRQIGRASGRGSPSQAEIF
jgi:hypothetical protein